MLPEHIQRQELFRAKAAADDMSKRWRAAEREVERLREALEAVRERADRLERSRDYHRTLANELLVRLAA